MENWSAQKAAHHPRTTDSAAVALVSWLIREPESSGAS